MQAGRANNRNHAAGSRRYAADKPGECRYCYFWNGRRKCCGQRECYYLLPEEIPKAEKEPEELSQQYPVGTGDCQSCPYGRHSPCIGYCIRKIMLEMKQKRQAAGKEGNRNAGRGK